VQDGATQAVAAVGFKARISGGRGCHHAARSRQLGRRGKFAPRVSGSVQSDGTGRVDRFGGARVATAMLSLSPATRVFLALAPIDGRKSFNGLSTLVKETLGQEPTSGFLFVFVNKARNRLKILFWDGSVLALTRIPGKTADLKTRLPYWQTPKADGLDYHRLAEEITLSAGLKLLRLHPSCGSFSLRWGRFLRDARRGPGRHLSWCCRC
jgi:hypothetical protein